jgi:hypothetical protein
MSAGEENRMNRDFEVKQLLRAYRSGLMSEAMFEDELTRLEHEAAGQQPSTAPFQLFGREYRTEREAVLAFLDEFHATQIDAAVAFSKWASVCRTKGLRTGLMIIAERAVYHARVIERRVHELGGELRSVQTERGTELVKLLGNPEIPDAEKLVALTSPMPDPRAAVAPLLTFAEALTNDVETKQTARLIAEDELSTAAWLRDVCAALASTQTSPPSRSDRSNDMR